MSKVNDMGDNRKAEDERQLEIVGEMDEKSMKEEAIKLVCHNRVWLHGFGVGGMHGKIFPFKDESNNEIVNDFTNETDFVKYSDERYVRFLESRVAQLEYMLSLKDREVK